jgi:thymidylate synthase
MKQYLDLVEHVLTHGKRKSDPQGIGNIAVCGYQMRFDLSKGEFPLITTRSMKGSWKAMVYELLWFLSGSTNVADLNKHGVHLWDQWATPEICKQMGLPNGELGPIYGKQWRSFDGKDGTTVDQISQVSRLLRTKPDSRRMRVSAWNPTQIDQVFVTPCHDVWRLFHADGELSLHLLQSSGDIPVGIPFNTAEYALLLMMWAQVGGFKPKELIHDITDAHIYLNQIDGVKELLTRTPKPLPRVSLNPEVSDILDFRFEDFTLTGYNPHPPIKIPVAL